MKSGITLYRRSSLGDVVLTLPLAAALAKQGIKPTIVTSSRFQNLFSRQSYAIIEATAGRQISGKAVNLHRTLAAQVPWAERAATPLRRLIGNPTWSDKRHTLSVYAASAGLEPFPLPITTKGPLLKISPDRGGDHEAVCRVGIIPGAAHPAKAPPLRLLTSTILAIARRFGDASRAVRPVWIGDPTMKALCKTGDMLLQQSSKPAPHRLASDHRCLDSDLMGLAELTAGCQLIIGGDTGPIHLAQALDVPTVSIFGPTSSDRWGPWRENARTLELSQTCRPCSGHGQRTCRVGHRPCLNSLSPSKLLEISMAQIEAFLVTQV